MGKVLAIRQVGDPILKEKCKEVNIKKKKKKRSKRILSRFKRNFTF